MSNSTVLSLNQIANIEKIKYDFNVSGNYYLNLSESTSYYLSLTDNTTLYILQSFDIPDNSLLHCFIVITTNLNKNIYFEFDSNFIFKDNEYSKKLIPVQYSEQLYNLFTFNSGKLWNVEVGPSFKNTFTYFNRPSIITPILDSQYVVDPVNNYYLLPKVFTISSIEYQKINDMFIKSELEIYSDSNLFNRIYSLNEYDLQNSFNVESLILTSDLYYIRFRYVGREYISMWSNIYPVKFI